MRTPLRMTAWLAAAVLAWSAAAAEVRTQAWFLRQVTDLDRLFLPDTGVVSRQFSSYHRGSRLDRDTGECVGMDINGDAGHLLAVHAGANAAAELAGFKVPAGTPHTAFGDLEWVLDPLERNHVFFLPREGVAAPATKPPERLVAAIAGPGCVVRIWSADPRGKIRFYFDGNPTPVEFGFRELFAKGATDPDAETLARRAEWPFIRPFTFRRAGDGDSLASDCYLPIPFATSCLVALTEPSFYHIGYKTYPAGTAVETFGLPLSQEALAAFDEVGARLTGRGQDPKPARPGAETISQTVQLAPGQEHVLAALTGPRVVQSIHAKLESTERYAHSKVLLTAVFDDEPKPCVWSPLVNFFGTGFQPRDFRSLPLGYIDGEGYCYYPMPFRKQARFAIRNDGSMPATFTYRLVHAPAADLPADVLLFHAKYRREEVSSTFDYPFLQATGRGRFVGASLCIDDAWRSWWGEGDEKIWVDDDRFPSFFGTGSEDFFGDAWGIRTLPEPFFACSQIDNTREHAWTCCYRWMIPDDVPFTRQFRATIENYSERIWGPSPVDWDEDYVSVAYWYQAPGGTDFFEPVPVEKRRPWGKVPRPVVVEAEDIFRAQLGQGASLVTDEGQAYEFSHGQAVDLGQRAVGDTLTLTGPDLPDQAPYAVVVHTPPAVETPAAFTLSYDGQEFGRTPADYGRHDEAQIGAVVLPAGRPSFTLRFTSAGRAVFDCVQFSAARQLSDVREAEGATVSAKEGPEPVRELGVPWSGGRQLRFTASKAGDLIELEAPIPNGKRALVVGLTRGPGYGNWDVAVNGKPGAGLLRGYAAQDQVADDLRIATLNGPNGLTRIRFTCAGRDDRATGLALGLDYIGWRRVVVDDAIEGETAELVDVKDGNITDQQLGERFSGGNHLWFHPTKTGASFTWLLDAPKVGAYDLSVYFTKSWDYAIVRLSLDGKPLGEFDTYAPTVEWAGESKLGRHDLTAGQHRLTFDVVGHNPVSKGILVGVDCLTLKPAP